jgi:predicted metal-dependent hydrolase
LRAQTKQPVSDLSALETKVATDIFKSEVRRWAKRIGVEPREIRLRDMTRKWASCSSEGRLTFDIDLLRQPHEFSTEVIVHELVHLKVPNHGKPVPQSRQDIPQRDALSLMMWA